MTLRLILTRHAKSSWSSPMMDDHARPLNKRGRRAAADVGKWLAGKGYLPDAALVSTAERTRETWQIAAQAMGSAVQPRFVDALYHAGPERMLAVLKGAGGQSVMLIAHNPGISWFAETIAHSAPADPRFAQYPTAATTVFDFAAERWRDVSWGTGTVVDLVFPRDLET